MAWFPFAILAGAAVYDLRKKEVPDAVWAVLLLWGLGLVLFGPPEATWGNFLFGLVLGLGVGVLLFRMGGFGGGDAKLFAALGSILGPQGLLVVFLYTALAGGILAIVARLRGKDELAYVPAIAAGFLVFLLTDGRLPHEILLGP
ncbi:MAG: prepilin peptidase [Planctomycetota bacterium]